MQKIIIIVVAGLILFSWGAAVRAQEQQHSPAEPKMQKSGASIYYCPMHPDFISDKPGSCPICGMNLVKRAAPEPSPQKAIEKKLLYYRNPMDPSVTSPVAMKDTMGMDYVPVYETDSSSGAGVTISLEKQQRIGVKKEKVARRSLTQRISTVGKVAYDPTLYVAQEEYLQAIKSATAAQSSPLAAIVKQAQDVVAAAEKKLVLAGMDKAQIDALAKDGKVQENLYLSDGQNKAWVYLTVYEYEMSAIKAGATVEITALAFPGETFRGQVLALAPVVNAATRALQVRAEVDNPDGKLKPEMFVNALIKVDLGDQLAVPASAVLDTGERKIVYLASADDRLQARVVILGQKADDYFVVLDGLKEGDLVVMSGNFLVDAESKLNAVLNEAAHNHGQ